MGSAKRVIYSGIMFACQALVYGCGIVPVGPAGCPNDATPGGSIVYQGTLGPASGATASGAVEVYKDLSSNYIIRLDGISLTPPNSQNTGLEVVGAYGGSNFTASLSSLCGTQNYSTGLTGNLTWSTVSIYSNINSVNYAVAPLH